jgi:D-ala D-ala ligase N-terminus
MKKLRVGILFGGRSGEHEVSLLSTASVLNAIDKNKYEVVPIGITKAQELDAAIRLEEIGLEEERLRIERRDEAECFADGSELVAEIILGEHSCGPDCLEASPRPRPRGIPRETRYTKIPDDQRGHRGPHA